MFQAKIDRRYEAQLEARNWVELQQFSLATEFQQVTPPLENGAMDSVQKLDYLLEHVLFVCISMN